MALLLCLTPVTPAVAADGALAMSVSITDTNGNPISVVDASQIAAYRVNVSYGCNVADCTNAKVVLAATPTDPYYGTHRKEQGYTWIPPYSPAPPITGSVTAGLTIDLGTVTAGSNGLIRVDYSVGGRQSALASGNFFPDGSPVRPAVTMSASNAAPVTGSAEATWKSYIPNPPLTMSTSQARINTDTELTVRSGGISGCWSAPNGVLRSIPYYLCGDTGRIVVDLPVRARYVTGSGGSYDPATHAVTLRSGPRAWQEQGGAFKVTFSSSDYPTAGDACVADETFTAHDATYTYLDGTTKATTPATAKATVQVGNCAPFAKGSVGKISYVQGGQFSSATWNIPTTAGGAYNIYWLVTASNQANVPGVATIVDEALDQADLPVTTIDVPQGGPATLRYSLDDGTTGTATDVTTGAKAYNAPAGRRVVAATLTSARLAAPNVKTTDTGAAPFSARFFATLRNGATAGTRTNTASATLTYPDNPELGTISATGSPASRTVTLVNPATPYTIGASNLGATVTGGGTALVGGEVVWTGNGSVSNLTSATALTPQYVFLAPNGWEVEPDGASFTSGDPGATFQYRTVTYGGNSHSAVVVTWPRPVTSTGTVTLPQLRVKTTPTGAAPAGTNNQTAYFFVGDAGNGIADSYTNVKVTDTTDVDLDGVVTDVFSRGSGSTSLAASPAIGVTKEICKPDADAADGCAWVSDSSVRVGVPPGADSIRYRVTVKNVGNASLSSAVAYDVLPYLGDTGTSTSTAGVPRGSTVTETLASVSNVGSAVTLAYSTSTDPPRPEVSSAPGTGDWTAPLLGARAIRASIGSIAAGGSQSFEYVASLVGGSADQVACNSVAVASGLLVPVEPTPVCATTQEADLSIDSTDHLPLQAGRVGVVPFVVENGGGSQAATGTVTISVPAGVGVVDLAPAGWACSATSTTGPVQVACVPVDGDGATRSLAKDVPETIRLRVRPTQDAPSELCFDASVEGLMSDPSLADNTARSCSVTLSAEPRLVVTKDDARTAVAVGEELTYRISASSRLVAEPIDGVTVTDVLPDSLELVAADPPPASVAGQALTWDLGRLEQAGIPGGGGDLTSGGAGSARTVTVTVRVRPGARDSVTNVARATGTDPADAAVTLTASNEDVDTVTNVFTDLGASETTPQNTPVVTPVDRIASAAGAPLDPTMVTQATPPGHGSLTVDAATGAVTYRPTPGYSGPDTYRVQVCDTTSPTAQCFVATVAVLVGVNVVEAVGETVTTTAGEPVTTAVRSNDTTQSGQPLAAPTVTVAPARGSAVVNPDGTIDYTPATRFSGRDSYTYRVCDTSQPDPVCDSAVVTVDVANVFVDGPAARGNTGVEVPHNTPVATALADIVTPRGAPLDPTSVTEVTPPSHGTTAVDPATGAVSYTPAAGYAGPDLYTVTVCDTATPDRECHEVTVAVTVLANTVSAPDLAVETRTNQPTAPVDVVAQSVSGSGEPLAAPTVTRDPTHGTVVVQPDGTVVYTPEPDFDGEDSFTYRVCDTSHPTSVCDSGTVSVTVSPVADLVASKTVTTGDVVAGLPIEYDAALTNVGPSTARDVHSIDPVPAAILDPVGTPDPSVPGAACRTRRTGTADLDRLDAAHGPYTLQSHPTVVECTYPVLPAGTTVHDTVRGTVDPALSAGSELVNQVVVLAATYDPVLANNTSATTSRTSATADLVVTKVADGTTVRRGDTVRFTVTVVNEGPSVATGVEVVDTPTGLRAVASDASAGTFSGGLWRIGSVGVGEGVTLTSDYRVTGPDAANHAVAGGDLPDPVLADNSARVQLRVADAASGGQDDDDRGDRDGEGRGHGDGRGDGAGGLLPFTGAAVGAGPLLLAVGLLLSGAGALVLGRRS